MEQDGLCTGRSQRGLFSCTDHPTHTLLGVQAPLRGRAQQATRMRRFCANPIMVVLAPRSRSSPNNLWEEDFNQ